MIHVIARGAHRLDTWLQARLGRPYNALLGFGLSVEIVRRLFELPEHLREAPRLAGVAVLVAMNLALLIHQIGEMSDRIRPHDAESQDGRRRDRRASRPSPTSEP
jgi:hypothetical protein